jgi:hypothetical protein
MLAVKGSGSSASTSWIGLACAGAVLLVSASARASDGGHTPPPPPEEEGSAVAPATSSATYYESALDSDSAASLASPSPELPRALEIADATATAELVAVADRSDRREWELRIEGFERRHERVDATYDMVLVVPLPAGADGRELFRPLQRGVRVEEGAAGRAVPLVYGGEKIVLKRNVGIEKTLLPGLVGSQAGGLPDLAGSGYRWTAWDAIVPRDPSYGEVIQARATLRYETPLEVAPPDPADARLAAYLVTWIPSLPATVPPYAVRIDVRAPASP